MNKQQAVEYTVFLAESGVLAFFFSPNSKDYVCRSKEGHTFACSVDNRVYVEKDKCMKLY